MDVRGLGPGRGDRREEFVGDRGIGRRAVERDVDELDPGGFRGRRFLVDVRAALVPPGAG